MHQTHLRTDIQRVLNNFTNGELTENATYLLKVLGYQSQRTLFLQLPEPCMHKKVAMQATTSKRSTQIPV